MYTQYGICRLDCITTVVDALRLQDEFACGNDLTRKGIDEEDIENLIIQQIEFCNIILLNKAAEVKPEELERIKQIIRTLQPAAEIIECNYADVDLKKIIHTDLFDFERVATSAGWIRGIEKPATEEEEKEAHGHHHHEEGHDHHHEEHEHHHEEHEHHHEEHGHHHHHHHEGGKWKNTASVLSFTTAVRHSTFTNSTISSLPDGAATSSVPKAYAISATTATCPTFLNRQALRNN